MKPKTKTQLKKRVVPFHKAKLDKLEQATLLDGLRIECGKDACVEAYKVKEKQGLCIRLSRPTNDGAISELVFGLTPAAAEALRIALEYHLSHQD